jgi:hypothetical protein
MGSTRLLRDPDARQRKASQLFTESREIAPREIAALFGVKQSAASALCLTPGRRRLPCRADASSKAGHYRLADALQKAFYK